MILFDSIREFVASFDRKELRLWGSVYVGVCALIVTGIIIRHVFVLKDIKSKIVILNKSRTTIQEILTQYQAVEAQKNKVAEDLKANKGFRIQKFFQDMQAKYPAIAHATSDFSFQKLANGYTQESLALSFSNIDTKQLCEILQDIENESLVYVTLDGIDISKISHGKKINVKMSIATLRAEE